MLKTKISAFQLFSMILLFTYGTAALYFLAPDAKRDAWLTLLLFTPVGVILQLLYTELYYQYPEDTLVTYLPKIFGRFIGYTLSILYILFFIYNSARNLRDFAELILIAVMPEAPLLIISIVFIITFAYGAFAGLENMARAAQIGLPIVLFFIIIILIALYATSNVVKFYNLKPVLENGIFPVVKAGLTLPSFPFGESITFAMLYCSTNEPAKVRKTSVSSIICIGILLSINTIMFIVSLGVDFASTSLFPLYESMRLIKLGGVFDKLDILIVIWLSILGSMKVSIMIYVAMLGTAQLIKINDPKYLAAPFGIGILILSILIASNYAEHIWRGQQWTLYYIHYPLVVIVPLLALIVHYVKKALQKRTANC